MMTHERMTEIANELVTDLDMDQVDMFAREIKSAIQGAGFTSAQLEELDSRLYYAGVDVNPVCRHKHPPAPIG